jgi:hypothetical protein
MPNWCSNNLTVTGRGVGKLIQYVKDTEFDFNLIKPMPIVIRMFNEFGRHTGKWYSWCIANWGTKWGAEVCGTRKVRGGYCVYFDTAWAPAIPIVERLSQKFPKLKFSLYYEESGSCFAGTTIYVGGRLLDEIDQTKEMEERLAAEEEE